MKVSGFTFVRNAIRYDYPVVEAITSILPLCDEFIVAVGNSDDGTRALIESIASPVIRIVDTVWDDGLREGGRVLAVETDKAMDAIDPASDWAFYIQADEVVHEKYHDAILKAMHHNLQNSRVEGLVFDYIHFYGSYDFVGDSPDWYRREVRIVRNVPDIRSWRDAQGFRRNGKKLLVVPAEATVYHYGWVKPPEHQQAKQQSFHRYWHDDRWIERSVAPGAEFDYSGIDSLARFTGTHPSVMQPRIAQKNWEFLHDPSRRSLSLRNHLVRAIEQATGWRPGEYKNFRLL